MITKAGLIAAAAVLALCACAPKPEAAKEEPAAVAANADVLAPGVWETTLSGEGAPSRTITTCVDAAHAKPNLGTGPCASMERTKTAEGVWSIQAKTCGAAPNGPFDMSGEMRGDLNSAYSIDLTAHVPAGVLGKTETSLAFKVEAKKTADVCPASLPPGAIDTPEGTIDRSGMKGAP